MPDLGLSQLTDDQTLNLLQEVLQELASRDPIVRQLAQQHIVTESEKLDMVKAGYKAALDAAKEEYERQLYADIHADVATAIRCGELKVMDGDQEAKCIADTHKEVVNDIITAMRAEKAGNIKNLRLDYSRGKLKFSLGNVDSEMACTLGPRDVEILEQAITQIFFQI